MYDVLLNWRMLDVLKSPERFKTVVGGRRIGKTELLIAAAIMGIQPPKQTVWYVAPTYRQAKDVFWERINEVVPHSWLAGKPNESELRIDFRNGSVVALKGADNPNTLRGKAVHKFLYDELDMWKDPETAHSRVLYPMLMTTQGSILAAGSPDGFRLLHDFYQNGGASGEGMAKPGWRSWLFKTSQFLKPEGHLEPEEYELAKQNMDQRSFDQEWNASFLLAAGRVVYAWSRENCKPIVYDPDQDVYLSLDFNVTPAGSVLAHVENKEVVHQFGEIHMTDGFTQLVADEAVRRLKNHRAKIRVYGDPAGSQRSSSSKRTDWQIVEDTLRAEFGNRVLFNYARNTIPERDTINALNARICNSEGTRRYYVNPVTCRETVKDFEQCKATPEGMVDKTDRTRTHWLDAAKYLTHALWPITGTGYRNMAVNF